MGIKGFPKRSVKSAGPWGGLEGSLLSGKTITAKLRDVGTKQINADPRENVIKWFLSVVGSFPTRLSRFFIALLCFSNPPPVPRRLIRPS